MTSTILYKTRCPRCAEQGKDKHGDNLAVYSDGHSYCYSCNYITSNNSRRTSNLKKPIQEVSLPLDCDWTLPPEPTKWLLKYFEYNDIPLITFWSEERLSLIFPIYDDPIKPTKLLAYQERYFGDDPKRPKWRGYGIDDSLIQIGGEATRDSSIVLVEDLISYYKVSKVQRCMCLFGSNVSSKKLAQLILLNYKHIILWLDFDKYNYAQTVVPKARMLGLQTSLLVTKEDPKEYSYEEITKFISVL